MSRLSILGLVFLAVCLAGCRDFALDSEEDIPETGGRSVDATQEQPFLMRLGDVATLEHTDVEIEFSLLGEESRCPSGVECIHPGKATIILTIRDSQNVRTQVALSIPGLISDHHTNGSVTWQGLTYQLLNLSPYPRAGVPVEPHEIRALLRVEQTL